MAKKLQAVDLDFNKTSRLLSVLLESKNGKLWVDTLSQMGYDLTQKRVVVNDGEDTRTLLQDNDIIRFDEYQDPDIDTSKIPDLFLVLQLLNVISGFTPVKSFDANIQSLFPILATPADRWLVTVSGTVQGKVLKEGDFILPAVAEPERDNPAHWIILEGNKDLATDTVMGLVYLATIEQFADYDESNKNKVVTLEIIKQILEFYPFLLSFKATVNLTSPYTDVVHNLGVTSYSSFQLKSGNVVLHTNYQELNASTVRIFTDINMNNVKLSIIA